MREVSPIGANWFYQVLAYEADMRSIRKLVETQKLRETQKKNETRTSETRASAELQAGQTPDASE